MKNKKTLIVNKWSSTVRLDTHLAKSLPLHFQRSLCLSNMRFNLSLSWQRSAIYNVTFQFFQQQSS